MAYNQKPETPLVNNGEFGDKIEKVAIKPAKKIDVESKEPELRELPELGSHGPHKIRNPFKKMGDGSTKE